MTDTVNVPREPTTEMLEAIDDAMWRGPVNATPSPLKLYRAMLAAAPKAEPDEADDFGDALLAFLFRHGLKVALDVSEIEALRQSAIRAQPEAQKVEQEPVAWRWQTPIPHVGDGTRWGWTFASHASTPPASINAEPLYTHPAPASDELLSIVRVASAALQLCAEGYKAEETAKRALSAIAKHKGPQS